METHSILDTLMTDLTDPGGTFLLFPLLLPVASFDLAGIGRPGIDGGGAVAAAMSGAFGWRKLRGDLVPVLAVGAAVLSLTAWTRRRS